MKIIKNTCALIVCLWACAQVSAQTLTQKVGNSVSIYSLQVQPNTSYKLNFAQSSQSLSIVYAPGQHIGESYLSSGEQRFKLYANLHSTSNTQQYSHPILLKAGVQQCTFYSGKLKGELELHVYHLGNTQAVKQKVRAHKARFRTREACGKPGSVPQSVWRAGLTPEPIPDPVVTDVKHLIVHHSVSSNDAADQVAILRGIYLYHRVTLGWNDIAYNYLIAPDGTIYEGRDPQGKEAEGDNIRGGHFCTGRQDGTMGVCLLGTFTDYEPPVVMLSSLVDLLVWKVKKDGMDPFGAFAHPINNPVVAALPVVAPHRAGCSTQCPGDKVFERMEALREKINADVQVCAGKTDECAPLRLTGELYNGVDQLVADVDAAINQCQNSNTGCEQFCTGKVFTDRLSELRSKIQAIEQICNTQPQNCVTPCSSAALLNKLTTVEQTLNAQIQFWFAASSLVPQQVAQLQTEVNNALKQCQLNVDSCQQFYPTNAFEARIKALNLRIDSLQGLCNADAATDAQKAEALRSTLQSLEQAIATQVAQLSEDEAIGVYPNPVASNGVLVIKSLHYQKIRNIRLVNILGKAVDLPRNIIDQRGLLVLLPKIPSGWYMLEFQLEGKIVRRRLLIL
ncbi:N-acetylmuramoyl-L-alanine amidase [Microscilla marina]|uniref:N-acetylmuramoyl-L-alanine amidase domain protein n=1 Tax=Microscilla marina ATCC 23134 TaxID=313606 RepID=A1ZRG5_MICM2|nr:N-acetylmuramoyl-L-alanine amidase [Microscilla marina]EAY27055.1 N-acetylmuramoyl-L-alanine amidase domain protein [Microscilla marina ATCC 23134]